MSLLHDLAGGLLTLQTPSSEPVLPELDPVLRSQPAASSSLSSVKNGPVYRNAPSQVPHNSLQQQQVHLILLMLVFCWAWMCPCAALQFLQSE